MQEVPLEGHDTPSLTAALTRLIEEQIRKSPEQWVWMHQRWKSAPPTAS
jgi:KDO2-lipid IV(A) lauroyltransferase